MVDGETVATYQCYDMVGFAELLADLSCDEMIAVAEEQYATRRRRKTSRNRKQTISLILTLLPSVLPSQRAAS